MNKQKLSNFIINYIFTPIIGGLILVIINFLLCNIIKPSYCFYFGCAIVLIEIYSKNKPMETISMETTSLSNTLLWSECFILCIIYLCWK